MSTLKSWLNLFIHIIAGNTCGAAIYTTLFYREASLTYMLLWQIIGGAALCTLGNVIFISSRELSGKEMKIRWFLHYLYINAVIIGWAILCGWITPITPLGILVLVLIIGGVYAFISFSSIRSAKRTALELNKKLRKVNGDEEEKM